MERVWGEAANAALLDATLALVGNAFSIDEQFDTRCGPWVSMMGQCRVGRTMSDIHGPSSRWWPKHTGGAGDRDQANHRAVPQPNGRKKFSEMTDDEMTA
jgi:hypothetical protein